MTIKVSVVVPVYNPGPHIEDCISSILRQSLPSDEFEAVFVDDGSTDGTPARLDALAAEHEHVTVIHQEPSGWSGKPRNVGVAAARGEYVQFVDNDDYLGDEALERLYDCAKENGSDVVIGRMAGIGRSVPRELFKKNRPDATLANSQIVDSLTPHKMFRKAFLEENEIRFAEGRRRLEDHLFVIEAFLKSARTSVLSDYVCYYHITRDDVSNAAFQRIDPVGYLANLEEAMDLVDKHLPDGRTKNKVMRRWLRVEMVERMRGGRLLKQIAPEDRAGWFDGISRIVKERMDPAVAEGLPPAQRAVAEVFTEGRVEELVELAEWERTLRCVPHLDGAVWNGRTLRLEYRAELRAGGEDGEPVLFRHEEGPDGAGRDVLVLPGLDGGGRRVDATERLAKAKAELLLRSRDSGVEVYAPTEFRVEREPVEDGAPGSFRVVIRATATVDPANGGTGGRALPPHLWFVSVRLHVAGWTKDAKLGRIRQREAQSLPRWISRSGPLELDLAARPAPGEPDPAVANTPQRRRPPMVRRARRKLGRIARKLGLR